MNARGEVFFFQFPRRNCPEAHFHLLFKLLLCVRSFVRVRLSRFTLVHSACPLFPYDGAVFAKLIGFSRGKYCDIMTGKVDWQLRTRLRFKDTLVRIRQSRIVYFFTKEYARSLLHRLL